MFLAGKTACAAVVFVLLAIGVSGPRLLPLAAEPSVTNEVPAAVHQNDIKAMQETLRDRGHYGGTVDGVFGLRTRASIRGFQKAENLPVTGVLDAQTAGKLGVAPEGRADSGYETATDKPSAGITWPQGSVRPSVRSRKPVKRSGPTGPPS